MGAFSAALDALLGDPNIAIDITYRSNNGEPDVICRAAFAQPDLEVQLQKNRVRDQQRLLLVRACDVAQPSRGDVIVLPDGTSVRVTDFKTNDPSRLTWRIEAAPL